jgi:peptidoglycan hydrolase CwlO-like protein
LARWTDLEADQAILADQRARWHTELQTLADDRARLQRHAQELENQLERLTVTLLSQHGPETVLSVAA